MAVTKKVEEEAVSALEHYLRRSGCADPQFLRNDKSLLWDGEILV